jgi:hypothetical protein
MPNGKVSQPVTRAREGTAGRLKNPARPTFPRMSALRISHFPDPQQRRYADRSGRERLHGLESLNQPLDIEGCQISELMSETF